MSEYITSFEELFNRLSAMERPIENDMQMAMFLASFGGKNKSAFGFVFASLQSYTSSPTWETATARLLQEYDEQEWASSGPRQATRRGDGSTIALSANQYGKFQSRSGM